MYHVYKVDIEHKLWSPISNKPKRPYILFIIRSHMQQILSPLKYFFMKEKIPLKVNSSLVAVRVLQNTYLTSADLHSVSLIYHHSKIFSWIDYRLS